MQDLTPATVVKVIAVAIALATAVLLLVRGLRAPAAGGKRRAQGARRRSGKGSGS